MVIVVVSAKEYFVLDTVEKDKTKMLEGHNVYFISGV